MLKSNEVKLIITDYMKYQNYSQATIDHHVLVLNLFNRYLFAKERSKDFRDIKEPDLFSFIEYCKNTSKKGLCNVTQNHYIYSMKAIFKMLYEEEKILFNPFNDVPYIKAAYSVRDKILTEEEINTLLNCFDTSKLFDIRDKTIISILYGTGIRPGELFNLKVQDFIKDEKFLFIRQGKCRKDRIIPLGESVFSILLYYMQKVRPHLVKRKAFRYIFNKRNSGQMNRDTLEVIIKKFRKKACFKKKINPHMFRHTFATHLLNNGADIREVQLLLGHASLKATEIYLNLTAGYLKDVYVKYHPIENELYFDVYGRESYIFKQGFKAGVVLLSKKKLKKS